MESAGRNLEDALAGRSGVAIRGARGTPGPTLGRALGTIDRNRPLCQRQPIRYTCFMHTWVRDRRVDNSWGGEGVSAMPKTRSPYAAEFRQQMVDLVRSGRAPEDLAREFEPSSQAIRTWVAQAGRDAGERSCQRSLRNDGIWTGRRPQPVGRQGWASSDRSQSGRACAEPSSRPRAPRSGGGAERRALRTVSTRRSCGSDDAPATTISWGRRESRIGRFLAVANTQRRAADGGA